MITEQDTLSYAGGQEEAVSYTKNRQLVSNKVHYLT